MARIKFRSCKACGNRYPKKEGYGYFDEFCSDGCKEKWDKDHPGYLQQTKRKKIILCSLISFCIIVILLLFFTI